MPETFPPAIASFTTTPGPACPRACRGGCRRAASDLSLSVPEASQVEVDAVHGRTGEAHIALAEQPNRAALLLHR